MNGTKTEGKPMGGPGGRSGGFGGGGGRDDRDGRGERGERGGRGGAGGDREGRGFGRKKVCRYCADPNAKVDYKNPGELKYFITERGKIVPRRISGNCARHQRQVATAIKRGRNVALLPYTVMQNQ
jgi:small subunit ribosomal protein S18